MKKVSLIMMGSFVALVAAASLTQASETTTGQAQTKETVRKHKKVKKSVRRTKAKRDHYVAPVATPAPAAEVKTAAQDVAATPITEKAPTLQISGEMSSNFYVFKTKKREENGGKGRGTHIALDDSRLNFEAAGSVPALDYSLLIGVSGNTEEGENPIQEARLKFVSRAGSLLLGNHRGPTDFMAVGAFSTSASSGTGGVYGNYKAVINETSGVVIRDDLALSGKLQSPKDMTKVTYVTPRVFGIQVGYAYTPDGLHRGEAKLKTYTTDVGVVGANNIHELGVNWKHDFQCGLSAALSLTGLTGKSRDERRISNSARDASLFPFKRHNPKAYAVGMTLKYQGFEIGGEYLDNRKSGVLKGFTHADGGKVYTAGIGYTFGLNTIGLTYLHSKHKLGQHGGIDFGNVKADVGAVVLERQFYTGLSGYVEGVAFKYKATNEAKLATWHTTKNALKGTSVGNNRGTVTTLGMKMKF